MSHYQPDSKEQETRVIARRTILRIANHERDERLKPYTMRSLQRAVFKVRRLRLVKPELLIAAGFNGS